MGLVWAVSEEKAKGGSGQGRAGGLRRPQWQCHMLIEVEGVICAWLCPEGLEPRLGKSIWWGRDQIVALTQTEAAICIGITEDAAIPRVYRTHR